MAKPEIPEMTTDEIKEALKEIARGESLEVNLKEFEDEAISILTEEDYREEAIHMLEDMGLPIDTGNLKKELMEERPKPKKIKLDPKALLEVLYRVGLVRKYRSENDIENAVLQAIYLGRAANRVNLPRIEQGVKNSETASDNRGKRTTYENMQEDERKARNQKIYEAFMKSKRKNPSLNPNSWAENVGFGDLEICYKRDKRGKKIPLASGAIRKIVAKCEEVSGSLP